MSRLLSNRSYLYIIITIFALGVVGRVWLADRPAQDASPVLGQFITHAAPKKLPPLQFTLLGAGGAQDLSAYRGRVVLLNLWATWCAPCREEMPQLDALHAAMQARGLTVLALSLDRGAAIKPIRFLESIGVSHLVRAHDASGMAGNRLAAFGLPSTLLIDRQGRELGRLYGIAEWNGEAMRAMLARVLAAD